MSGFLTSWLISWLLVLGGFAIGRWYEAHK